MAASEAAVTAVRSVLRLHPYRAADEGVGWECGCGEHFANYGIWQEHLAVSAADAAVDADRASIQAETLREVADEVVAELVCCDIFDGSGRGSTGNHAICYWGGAVEKGLRARADRIEAQP